MSQTTIDPYDTSLGSAIARSIISATANLRQFSEAAEYRYNLQFDAWKASVLAGKIPNTNPPTVPAGYVLTYDELGFADVELGVQPVCSERTDIPPDYSKPFELVLPEPTHVRNVPKGDTEPVGHITIDPDGKIWQKQSSVTPFGVAYFYQRVG